MTREIFQREAPPRLRGINRPAPERQLARVWSVFVLVSFLVTDFTSGPSRSVVNAADLKGGFRVDDLVLKDINGRRVDPFTNTAATAHVFVTASNDCPISNRYAPEVRRLCEDYAARGVAFYIVHPNPDETPEAIGNHATEYGYPCPVLIDEGQLLIRRLGMTMTPEAAIVDARRRRIYRGRIDDRHVEFGKMRPSPTRRDVAEVLDAILSGKAVTRRATKAVGCSIVPIDDRK